MLQSKGSLQSAEWSFYSLGSLAAILDMQFLVLFVHGSVWPRPEIMGIPNLGKICVHLIIQSGSISFGSYSHIGE